MSLIVNFPIGKLMFLLVQHIIISLIFIILGTIPFWLEVELPTGYALIYGTSFRYHNFLFLSVY